MKRYGVFEGNPGSPMDLPILQDYADRDDSISFADTWHEDNQQKPVIVYDSVDDEIVYRLPKPAT
jgi:hypothetical protein